jgi:mRNA interferase MazF
VAAFGRASVVLVEFPFSDLSDKKLRPAVVLAQANRQDWFLCQITSNAAIDAKAIQIQQADFAMGSLRQESFARPDKVFTGHETLIERRVGVLSETATSRIVDAVVAILKTKS